MFGMSFASCGSQEIGSCIIQHLKEIASGAKRLVLYSDACGGQNRNINLVTLWQHIVASDNFSYEVIDHKYMATHTYRMTGISEVLRLLSDAHNVFVPTDWQSLIRDCHKNAFTVREMKRDLPLTISRSTSLIASRTRTNRRSTG